MKYIIIIALCIAGVVYRDNIAAFFRYIFWKRRMEETHSYNVSIVQHKLYKIADIAFNHSKDTMPSGRAGWFLRGNEAFCSRENIESEEVYGYTPVRSKEELDFHEYGLLLTQNGLFASWQCEDKDSEGKYIVHSCYCPFQGLWYVDLSKDKQLIRFYYPNGKIVKINSQCSNNAQALILSINDLIQTGYTKDLDNGYVQETIFKAVNNSNNRKLPDSIIATRLGAIGAIYANVPVHFQNELLNGIVNNPQGHGIAAEYVNNVVDKVKNPFLDVRRVGQNNAKNGADRIVGNVEIQTKYLSSARNSVNAAFDKAADGGMYRYSGMQLEVPKDQYLEAIEIMEQKILDGKVPGVTNPEDAKNIIRKGNVTWNESKLIAEGGNIVSLKYDVLDGVVQTLPVAGISFVLVFARAKWLGNSNKEAAIIAAKSSLITLGMGTVVYAGSQQIAKIFTNKIAEETGKKIAADNVAQNVGLVISLGIIMAPNIFDSLTGRISKQQLLKNTIVAGGGFGASIASSAMAGAAMGSVVPGAGNAVGAVVGTVAGVAGGMAGTLITKKIMDQLIPDDRIEMFAQLKEEYIDVVMEISLTQEEFVEIQEVIFDKKIEDKLKKMYRASNKGGSRQYAREQIVENAVKTVISKRDVITAEEILDGYQYLITG